MGMMMLTIAVGLGAWSLGRVQQDGANGPGGPGGSGGHHTTGGGFGGTTSGGNTAPPNGAPPPHSPPPQPETPRQEKPQSSWQRPPPPQPGQSRPEAPNTPKAAWERAKAETKKREEEAKQREEERKKAAEAAERKRQAEERIKQAREKERLERLQREQEAKARLEKLKQEAQREKERKEKEERDRLEKEKVEREKAEQERASKAEAERQARTGSTYANSGVGEKTSLWPNGKPPAAASTQPPSSPQAAKPAAAPPSPTKRPPAPTAKTFTGIDEDTYSFRPYDKPKRQARKKSISDDMSESSWAPSMSTARTTPPPSVRQPYSTKDPDKIVIRAVYGFLNQFAKTPSSQLISGTGNVTDGLILRITTEGLFIDDDVRSVPQREWDVKAWTLKLVEVWCPTHFAALANSNEGKIPSSSANLNNASFFQKAARLRNTARGETKAMPEAEVESYLSGMLDCCESSCRLGLCDFAASAFAATASTASSTNSASSAKQTGEWKAKGLHLLRATLRDQENKRYMFVIGEEESWKVSVGLQRLRKGSQVRSLGVAGMNPGEVRTALELLGWGWPAA